MIGDEKMFNLRGEYNKDARYLFSGKDTEIRDGDGLLLSTVESFTAAVTMSNAKYQPLGSTIIQEFLTAYETTLTIMECIVEDTKFIQDMFDFFTVGRHSPVWTFSSIIHGYDGSVSRYIYRDCIPTAELNLHNFTAGDIIKREWKLHCQQPPEIQNILSIPE